MRQNCITCHGPGGTSAMRTSHPDRQNCLQCHATNAFADQGPALGGTGVALNSLPPPLPAAAAANAPSLR
jgi:cytochrome c-type protein NapB